MLAIFVGLIEIGLGLGKLGFVADLLSKEVQVGYMNGLGITIIVGQLPKLFGFSTDADDFVEEVRAFVAGPRPDGHDDARASGSASSPCCSCCRGSRRKVPAILVAVVGATVVVARRSASPTRASRPSARCPQGVPDAGASRGPTRATSVPLLLAAVGHHARLAHRHDRHRDELRGPPRRRGRARPGDDRHGRRERRRRASSRGSRSRPAARAPRWPSSPAPRARSPAWSAPASSRCCCCSSTRCSPTCRRRRSPPWSSSPRSR